MLLQHGYLCSTNCHRYQLSEISGENMNRVTYFKLLKLWLEYILLQLIHMFLSQQIIIHVEKIDSNLLETCHAYT